MFVFDGRFIRIEAHDGISRFSTQLLAELSKIRTVTVMLCDPGQVRHIPEGIDYFFECPPTSIRELGLGMRLNQRGVTTLYSPMQTTGKLGAKFKVFLTLHDLIYYQHRKPPSEFSALVQLLWRVYHLSYWPARLLLKRARGLVTISYTSKELIERHKLFDGPIEVIYNAASSSTNKPLGKNSTRVCYVGSFMPYKDVETLIRGVAKTRFELHLLSGISPMQRNQLQELANSVGAKVIFHNGVSESEYQALLADSFALLSASRAEGFGIPLIEAMSAGVPVICSDIEIFREVGGDAALYFAPGDAVQLGLRLSELGECWSERSKLSKANAARFDWARSAKALAEFLDVPA